MYNFDIMAIQSKNKDKVSTQIFNPSTGNYIKRNSITGRFEVKSDGSAFEGIKIEVPSVRSNPAIKKATAKKAEKAVIAVRNKMASAS
jgi:hypothetical protein